MHFLTQAASGALLLCLAPHMESLMYPETLALISAAIAGTVERAKTPQTISYWLHAIELVETTAT